jgi:hypothetical protein
VASSAAAGAAEQTRAMARIASVLRIVLFFILLSAVWWIARAYYTMAVSVTTLSPACPMDTRLYA